MGLEIFPKDKPVGGPCTAILIVCVVDPKTLEAVTVYVADATEVPTVGVPVIAPVVGFIDKPPGKFGLTV
jgi:hypothetical protein